MRRTTVAVSHPGFIVDMNSIVRENGVSIDWDKVDADAKGDKYIKGGTLMCEGPDGVYPRSKEAGAVLATLILTTDASTVTPTDALNGYGALRAGYFYKNLLPESSDANFDTYISELGPMFQFQTYKDVR